MSGELRPILPKPPRGHRRPKSVLTHIVRVVSLIAGLAIFAASIWYFSGFAENDRGFWHLFNAALLSFGIGGLFYVPAFWIAQMAHKTLRNGIKPKILPILLVLPWLPISWRLAGLGDYWIYVAAGLGLYAGLVLIWMATLRKKSRSR